MSEDQTATNPAQSAAEAPGATGATGATSATMTGSPEERIAALEAEKQELRDRMLRVAAEFENYKKRVRKDLGDAEIKAKETVLKDLIEVLDNLERAVAVEANADVKSVQQGVQLVLRLFQSKLDRYEVRPIEAKGQPFDPRMHEAISQVPSAEAAPGSVLSELQKGYRIGERLLRPAMVVVAVAPPSAAGGGPAGE
jgi:molecular chaperone GrpE